MSRDACVDLARQTNRDPAEIIDWWLERASIREFEGGQSRDAAEHDAFEEVRSALEALPLIDGERLGAQRAKPVRTSRSRRSTEG